MKKLVSLILAMALLLSCTVLLTACDSSSSKKNKSEKSNVVEYHLSDINFSNITVDAYEYNYIAFDFENGTYNLKNKVKSNSVITQQNGEFTVDEDGYVTITNDATPSQDYFLYEGEDIYFTDEKQTTLYVEANIPGYGDVYMVFEKQSKSNRPAAKQTNKDAVNGVRYDLVDMEFSNITVDAYEYNYIEFNFNNGTYLLKNKVKANGIISQQSGKFTVDDDGYVEVTNNENPAQAYILYEGEDLYFMDDAQKTLYVEATIPGYGEVYMKFKK